jgi:glycolate oxidase iron-sulfur subunit
LPRRIPGSRAYYDWQGGLVWLCLPAAPTGTGEKILRTCVHCGFCTATCPTYVTAGRRARQPARPHLPDQGHAGERRPADEEVVKHVDRCLSCLSCMTTCPSGVHYMHLVDHARAHIEETYTRPWPTG